MHTSTLLLAAVVGLVAAHPHNDNVARAATNTALQTTFPKASGTSALAAAKTLPAGSSFDGGMKQWDRSTNTCQGQTEGGDKDAVFILENGATLSNAIIGPNNGEGVHCLGTCTLNNIWWVDVCEDAATFKQTSGTSYVNGGGAKGASDKVLQHNGGVSPRSSIHSVTLSFRPIPTEDIILMRFSRALWQLRTSTLRISASSTAHAVTAASSTHASRLSPTSRSSTASSSPVSTATMAIRLPSRTAA